MDGRSDPASEGILTPFAALLAAPLVFGFPLWPLRFHQAEDAYILHSFSRSLAETGSISFYAGGPHAEGATDFLWMLMLSLGYKLGIPPVYCSEILSMFAVLLLGVFLIRIAGKAVRPLRVLAVIAPLMLFPQMIAAYEGFSVTLFAASLAALVFYLQKDRPQAAAVAALVLCLLRPDGVVFAVPLLVVGILFGNRSLWLRWVGTLFVLPGLLYFLWRWHYFGEFLPLPFLVKSDTQRRFGLYVVSSVHDLRPFLAFAIVLLAVALGRRILERKQLAFAAALLVIPTLFYFAMRLDQNIATRFFFYVPVGAALLIALMWDRLAVRRAYVLVAGVVLWALFIAPLEIRYLKQMDTDRSFGRRWVGLSTDLSKVAPHGTLLTSETGVIPYYSHWQTYDPWGLSTAEFAHALIQPDQVVALHPDLVFMHVDNPVSNIPCQFASTPTRVRSWQGMAGNVALGTLKSGDYTYWQLPYEDPATTAQPRPGEVPDVVCAYIRQDFVGRGQVEEVLRRYAGQPTKPSEKLN